MGSGFDCLVAGSGFECLVAGSGFDVVDCLVEGSGFDVVECLVAGSGFNVDGWVAGSRIRVDISSLVERTDLLLSCWLL